jgi:hypothetical protein
LKWISAGHCQVHVLLLQQQTRLPRFPPPLAGRDGSADRDLLELSDPDEVGHRGSDSGEVAEEIATDRRRLSSERLGRGPERAEVGRPIAFVTGE